MKGISRALRPLAALLAAACAAEQVPQTPPRQLAGSPFHYPEELWDAGVEGETKLGLFVSVAGRVDSVRVDSSSGYPAFDSAAVIGAHDLRFEPARRGADPVGVWVQLPVKFDLPRADSAAGSPP